MGRLDSNKEPAFHDIYPKKDIVIHFNTTEPVNDCFSFTRSEVPIRETWERAQIFDRSIRSFSAVLGPSGGKRGYQGITGHVSNGLAWYINGFMVPELWLRRGLTYSFKVCTYAASRISIISVFKLRKIEIDKFKAIELTLI